MKRPRIKNWPKYLVTFRKVHGLSQAQLAEDIGTNVRNIENYEQGISKPSHPAMLHTMLKQLSIKINKKKKVGL